MNHGCWASMEMSDTIKKIPKISFVLAVILLSNKHTYHKGEGFGGDCFVVGVNAVPDAHFYLSLLHPVTCCIIQPAHDPEEEETQRLRDEFHYHCYENKCMNGKVFFCLLHNESHFR